MIYDINQWRKDILGVLVKLSDDKYQRRVWLGRDAGRISSPIEMYNIILGDMEFERFMNQVGSELSVGAKECGVQLVQMLNQFSIEQMEDPEGLLENQSWAEVRVKAGELSRILRDNLSISDDGR